MASRKDDIMSPSGTTSSRKSSSINKSRIVQNNKQIGRNNDLKTQRNKQTELPSQAYNVKSDIKTSGGAPKVIELPQLQKFVGSIPSKHIVSSPLSVHLFPSFTYAKFL